MGTFFHWLYVNVVGNLTASVLWAGPAFFHLHWKLNRQQRQRMTGPDNSGTIAGQFELAADTDERASFGFKPPKRPI